MLKLDIPGDHTFIWSHLVLDYNGTIACDGHLLPGVKNLVVQLSESLSVHILTADTFGTVQRELVGIPCKIAVIEINNQSQAKADYIRQLGTQETICVGNGKNDALMLKEASLGIAVIQAEGGAVETLLAADVVVPNISDALELLLHPLRLTATLRS
jgi:P-type E1-E2 ATPase